MDIDSLRIVKFCELTGWTKKAVEGKIYKGQWLEGKEYSKAPDGSLVVSIVGYEQWIKKSKAKIPSNFR